VLISFQSFWFGSHQCAAQAAHAVRHLHLILFSSTTQEPAFCCRPPHQKAVVFPSGWFSIAAGGRKVKHLIV
jgi:hypothetical protein